MLSVLLLAPTLPLPGVVAASSVSDAILCADNYTMESSIQTGTLYEWDVKVHFVNHGYSDAYGVTATISSAPANVDYTDDPDVTLGNIPVGGSAWSEDTFTLKIDMSNPQSPDESIMWRVEYYDNDGNPQVIENVSQFCPGHIPPLPSEIPPPPPPLTINTKIMTIRWASDGARWSRLNEDVFRIWGRLELPEGCTLADLEKEVTASIAIGGSSGSDTVELQERLSSRLPGVFWTYRGSEQPPSEGMNITKMVVWWAPEDSDRAGKAGFYISGVLELPETIGIGTEPPEATVTLSITSDECAPGEEIVTFREYPRYNRWIHFSRLSWFPHDPSGTE